MRYRQFFAILLGCAVWAGSSVPGFAAPTGFATHSSAGVSIDLPQGWHLLDRQTVRQIQEHAPSTAGGKAEILLIAEAPGRDFLKLTVTKVPGAMAQFTNRRFGNMSSAEVDKLCAAYKQNVEAGGQKMTPGCKRVKNAGGYALATGVDMPATGQRPPLSNVAWMFPRGSEATVVTFLCLPNERAAHMPLMQKILQTVKPGPDGK